MFSRLTFLGRNQGRIEDNEKTTKETTTKNVGRCVVVFLSLLILEVNLVELQGSNFRLLFRHVVFSSSNS